MVPSAQGINTDRDVTSSVSGDFKADDFISVVGSLKAQYRARARWIIHRDVEEAIRKLKTGTGDYIRKSGLQDGSPNRLLGFPVHLSEYMGNTFSSNEYVAILGDFNHYWIVDSLQTQVRRLDELYAETDQTGFICRYEGDGAPVVPEAFVRLQLA